MTKVNSQNSLIKIAVTPAIVLVIHILATVLGFYETFWWFDIPLHFMGGIAVAISAYYLLEDFGNRQKFHNQFIPLQILILIAFTALAAVLWEFMEFTFDIAFHTHMQQGLLDTIKDMAVGISSGGLTTILLTLKLKK